MNSSPKFTVGGGLQIHCYPIKTGEPSYRNPLDVQQLPHRIHLSVIIMLFQLVIMIKYVAYQNSCRERQSEHLVSDIFPYEM
jgi:hypothetical protein